MTRTVGVSDAAIAGLARRSFIPGDRIGWQYVEPEPVIGYGVLEPRWLEPITPDARALQAQAADGKRRLVWGGPVGGLLVLMGLPWFAYGGLIFVLIGLGIVATAFVPMMSADRQITEARAAAAAAAAAREHQWAAFQRAHAQHRATSCTHAEAQRHRVDSAMLWFPLQVRRAARIDVLGGDGGGRSALLATLGCSLLASRSRVAVLDLTDEGVASPLAALADAVGVPVRTTDLPADLSAVDLLADLDPGEAAELLAEAIHPRSSSDARDERDLAADLIRAVLSRLEARPSLARLHGGLRVLRNTYDSTTDDALTETEFSRLTVAAPNVAVGERSRNALHLLDIRLSLLVISGSGAGAVLDPLPSTGLAVVCLSAGAYPPQSYELHARRGRTPAGRPGSRKRLLVRPAAGRRRSALRGGREPITCIRPASSPPTWGAGPARSAGRPYSVRRNDHSPSTEIPAVPDGYAHFRGPSRGEKVGVHGSV